MLREVTAVESRRTELGINAEQAHALVLLGRELAAEQAWWADEPDTAPKSVIEVVRAGDDYSVTFRDVIGVVRVGDLQVKIRPKIPEQHFSYLITHGAFVPRVSAVAAAVCEEGDFASVLASWCVTEAEALLRRGLRSDYSERRDELSEVRGKLDAVATTLALQSGRLIATCDFEEFTEDSSLNRVVKAACERIAATPELGLKVRQRARRVVLRMGAVGRIAHGDQLARVTRLTRSYERALPLAHLVLQSSGVAQRIGSLSGRAFLVRTPGLIEDGLRNILSSRLGPTDVRKRKLSVGAGFTMNPDLVFDGGIAVADVKYQYLSATWHRANLYQAVAFAAALRCGHCAIFGFSDGGQMPPLVEVGDIVAQTFGWNAEASEDPNSSAERLVSEVREWLAKVRLPESNTIT